MSNQRYVVHGVSWRDLFPWLIIFRSFRLAISPPILMLATLGAVIAPVGWIVAESLFVDAETLPDTSPEFKDSVRQNRWWPVDDARERVESEIPTSEMSAERVTPTSHLWGFVYRQLGEPIASLFSAQLTFSQLAYYMFGGLWSLVVWAFVGGTICRSATVRLGREERIGFMACLGHSLRKWPQQILAMLYPLLGILLLLVPAALLGFFFLSDGLISVAAVLWVFALIGGFIATLLFFGLLFGWPLLWGAIGAESSDAFDAISRSYAYTYQRPLHYLFYAIVAMAIGLVSWLAISLFADVVIELTYWGGSWGANVQTAWEDGNRMSEVRDQVAKHNEAEGGLWFGLSTLRFWEVLVHTIAIGFRYSFFWTAISAIYLLLRKNVDDTEFDEVYLEDLDTSKPLPELPADENGVPGPPEGNSSTNESDADSADNVEDPDGE